jgi:hypothetical protein
MAFGKTVLNFEIAALNKALFVQARQKSWTRFGKNRCR